RGVARGRDAAGGAARDQDPQPGLGHPRDLAERRAEGRSDLHDRSLATDRAPRADAQGRGERLDHGYLRADAPAAFGYGEHHFGHAVAARLAREEVDQRPVEQSSRRRRENDEPEPEPVEVAVRSAAGGAVVAMAAEPVGEGEDQVAEEDGARAGTGAD